jgi:hypothetical protein
LGNKNGGKCGIVLDGDVGGTEGWSLVGGGKRIISALYLLNKSLGFIGRIQGERNTYLKSYPGFTKEHFRQFALTCT